MKPQILSEIHGQISRNQDILGELQQQKSSRPGRLGSRVGRCRVPRGEAHRIDRRGAGSGPVGLTPARRGSTHPTTESERPPMSDRAIDGLRRLVVSGAWSAPTAAVARR